MKNQKLAIKILLGIFTAVILFHISILLKIVPYEITWGGRLKNDTEMYVFESLSLLINSLLIAVLLMKGNYIKAFLSTKTVSVILWVFCVLFGLNTIGNIFAETNFEKFFTIITLASSFLIWSILRSDKKITTNSEK
ncbi:hypothetical protein [Flavicella sediminum]|uniref:hypothetical protein n=1 Tax=Flavicella sediminum TaxID=2585141 RepID=UPI00111F3BE9|nr:hypothetical protein [Flavicella sediminum]